jgi:hypothetical protein
LPPHPESLQGPPSLLLYSGYQALFPSDEADNSPLSRAKVRDAQTHTFTVVYIFMVTSNYPFNKAHSSFPLFDIQSRSYKYSEMGYTP